MKRIPLTKGKFSLVDDTDFEELSRWNWYYSDQGYAVRRPRSGKVSMHRVILPPSPGLEIDHINGDKLDNRRSNLRVVTHAENMKNVRHKLPKNGYRGVYPNHKRWGVKITHNMVHIYIATFDTPREAGYVYDQVASQLFGEFARLNLG